MTAGQWFYSAASGGFYLDRVHGEDRPDDCRPISQALHDALMSGQSEGKLIKPCPDQVARLVEPEISPDEVAAAVEAARQAAYAAEADPLFFKAQRGEATMDMWQAKVAEIKARYPDGVMPG